MRGEITVKVGRYQLAESVIMTIKAHDAGAMFSFEFPKLKQRHLLIIDEGGNIVFAEPNIPAASFRPAASSSATDCNKQITRPQTLEVRKLPESVLSSIPQKKVSRVKPTRIRFTILFGQKSRPRSRAFALAAFMDGCSFHILYRVEAAGITYYENQLMVSEGETAVGGNVPSKFRVAKSDWLKLVGLPGDTIFNLNGDGRDWRKMNDDEMRDFITGKTYRVTDNI